MVDARKAKEATRDQVESAFTPVLRRLRESIPSVLAAVFVDVQGECIDYASELDPYDAKVNAAHMLMVMDALRRTREKVGAGEPTVLEIFADERDLWVQRIGDEYVAVVVLAPGYDRAELRAALSRACGEFRQEVGLDPPPWDGGGARLSVRVRASPAGWRYAPEDYSADGLRVVITDVLGRWTEPSDGDRTELVCFRVRTDDGRELTLVHDPEVDGWLVRD